MPGVKARSQMLGRRCLLDMPQVGDPPKPPAPGGERRKFGLSRGHLQRWRAGEAPLVNTSLSIAQALERQLRNGRDTFTPEQLQQHLRRHHDAYRAEPQLALLLRPKSPEFSVALPTGRAGPATLSYDLHGRVQVHLLDLAVGGSPYSLQPAGPQARLTAADLATIGRMREALESGHTYSTLARSLLLARAVRQARAQASEPTSFAGVLAHLQAPGAQVLAAYGGGSCMHMAEVLAAQIGRRFGLAAYVATEHIAAGAAIERPRLAAWGTEHSQQVLAAVDGHSHTNVVVPYFDEAGEAKVLRVTTGVGPTAIAQKERKVAPLRVWSAAERAAAEAADPNLPPERLIGHPQRLMATAMPSSAKLHIRRWDNGMTLGLDVLRRTLYINRAALAAAGPVVDQIDLRHPGARADLPAFIEVVGCLFGLPEPAREDLAFLLDNLDDYAREVLAGPGEALSASIAARDTAVDVREPQALLVHSGLLRSWSAAELWSAEVATGEAAIRAAADAVNAGLGPLALEHYVRAAKAFGAAEAMLLDPQLPMDRSLLKAVWDALRLSGSSAPACRRVADELTYRLMAAR